MPERINYNPDILSCLANLSNDEVFTPPEIANAMLDMVPQELFSDPNAKFLDPACKSGVFLREIAKRLNKGLENVIPDREKRMEYIFKKQLFGVSITELTGLLSRRSLYCSKNAASRFSVANFKEDSNGGNIRYRKLEHTWKDGRCIYCGASQTTFNRGEEFETHAYEFIHDTQIFEVFKKMKFDLIISNPPYQLNVGVEKENYAIPIYQKFVTQAKKLSPRFLIMITPSRWFTGGRGLDDFRLEMLNDKRIKIIVDYPNSKDCFPGVDVAGGICYFLWDSNYSGMCLFNSISNEKTNTAIRTLNQFPVFPRYNEALTIIQKISVLNEPTLTNLVSSQTPFGFVTTFSGKKQAYANSIELIGSKGSSFVSKEEVLRNQAWIDKFKVIFSKATSEHAGTPDKTGRYRVFSTNRILFPNQICSQSYLVGGVFESLDESKNFLSYIRTALVRFLLLQALTSQDISREKFLFVPQQDFSHPWTDEMLYEKYGITEEEQAFIDSMIRPMDLGEADE